MTQKDIATILYKYYVDKYLEDDFSFDDGKTRSKIESNYKKLCEKDSKAVEYFKEKIRVSEEEGTDYDVMYFTYDDNTDLELQVTSMIDYDGNSPEGYDGDSKWCDVGMFWIDNRSATVDYKDLK